MLLFRNQAQERSKKEEEKLADDEFHSKNIYECVKGPDGKVKMEKFRRSLVSRGLLPDDPRIAKVMQNMDTYDDFVDKDDFIQLMTGNAKVIEDAFTDKNVILDFGDFSKTVREIYNECKVNQSGELCDNTPMLSRQNPDIFGVSICTVNGQRLNIGDSEVEFMMQGCMMPVNYCLAIKEHGVEGVHKYVGREPSGARFNALKLNSKGLPHNPMIIAGNNFLWGK